VPFALRPWPMLLLAVEDDELPAAKEYADAVGGEEVDLREDPWFADDLAGGFVVAGGYTLDAMGATVATAEAARRAGAEIRPGCEAKRIIVSAGRVTGIATDAGVIACGRVVVAAGPGSRQLVRTAAADVPLTASRGWLLETGRVDPPPRYAIEQALWPVQDAMAEALGPPARRRNPGSSTSCSAPGRRAIASSALRFGARSSRSPRRPRPSAGSPSERPASRPFYGTLPSSPPGRGGAPTRRTACRSPAPYPESRA
jgi:glycine/D-amino acid oxidase-like deaminating enzyme